MTSANVGNVQSQSNAIEYPRVDSDNKDNILDIL